jgi:hypothetical protein
VHCDTDIYIKKFVFENCLKIMTDIGKHESLIGHKFDSSFTSSS